MEPGPASQATTVATITNSILSKNRQYGFLLEGQKTKVDIDLCHADENVSIGYAVGFASVTIGRSVGANNGQIGLNNDGGTVMSYKDNRFAGNGLNQTNGTIGTATLN